MVNQGKFNWVVYFTTAPGASDCTTVHLRFDFLVAVGKVTFGCRLIMSIGGSCSVNNSCLCGSSKNLNVGGQQLKS